MKRLGLGLLLIAACTALPISAYWFEFSNHTNEELKVILRLAADDMDYEAILGPKSAGHKYAMHTFKFGPKDHKIGEAEWWKGGFCLYDVKIQTPSMISKEIVDDDGNKKVVWERAIEKDNSGKPILDRQGNTIPMWNPTRALELFHIKDEAYDAMIGAASQLADGVSEAAALAATTATGTPIPSLKVGGIVKSIGELAAYGQCKDMHFDLIPTNDYPKEKAIFNIIALTKKKG
jgi:hypothetical protein